MHLEFVGQDLARHPLLRWLLSLQSAGSLDDRLWRGSTPASHARYVSKATPRATAHLDCHSPSCVRISRNVGEDGAIDHDDAIGLRQHEANEWR
jgi:hypothetical protein